jgi:hypothetical protein
VHSSNTVRVKHPVTSSGPSGGGQQIPPLVKPDRVWTHAAETSQFTAVQGTSFGCFGTHGISLKVGTGSKVKCIFPAETSQHYGT